MSADRAFKRAVRARMATTGEPYMAARRALIAEREAVKPEPGTGCPACGSDDYVTEPGPGGQPDYEHGTKRCEECGEEWT